MNTNLFVYFVFVSTIIIKNESNLWSSLVGLVFLNDDVLPAPKKMGKLIVFLDCKRRAGHKYYSENINKYPVPYVI